MSTMYKSAGGGSPWVVCAWMTFGTLMALAVALLMPAELFAAAGGGSGATDNFNRNGKGALKDIGVPVFGATAMAGIVMAVVSKKFGFALMVVLISAVGLAISFDPEATMKTLGNGIADLFK